MKFNINVPVQIISGQNCLKDNSSALIIGTKALIVCGAHGASASGALDDVCGILAQNNIEYLIFDKITEKRSQKVNICCCVKVLKNTQKWYTIYEVKIRAL